MAGKKPSRNTVNGGEGKPMIIISWLVGAEKPMVPRDGREIAPTVSTPDRTGHPLPKKDEPWESIILWLTLGLG